MHYKTVFLYRRQIIILTFLTLIIALSGLNKTNAQVSGYMGDRYMASVNLSQDVMWWIYTPENYSLGMELAFDYVITRKSSIGITGNFVGMEDKYENSVNYFSEHELYSVSNEKFEVSSNVIELNYKRYRDKPIAPLGRYIKFSIGILSAGNTFDKELYKNNLTLSNYPSIDIDDVTIKKKSSYSSLFFGIGLGETFPITDYLLFNIDAELRVFTNSANMLRRFGSGTPDYDEYGEHNPENIIKDAVLTRAYIHNTVDVSFGLTYTF